MKRFFAKKFTIEEEKLVYECNILINVLGFLIFANFLVSIIALILDK
jgi:hypothetical protein